MKQNTKFLWMYIAILFSFALILIIFAGLSNNNYKKEIEMQASESAGVKKSLIAITEENQKLNDSIKETTKKLETASEEKEKLTSDNEILIKAVGGDEETTNMLLDANNLYNEGKIQEAKNALEEVDKKSLTKAQLYIYNTIIGG